MGKRKRLRQDPKPPRPNIVFLFADDQRADTIGAHGNPHIRTPNLDQLAAEGFSFRRNYCAGSFSGAVCVASRAMLMTGRHWMNLPANKPASNWGDATVLPALLTSSGNYNSFIVGKWHNGRGTLDKSFTNGRSIYMGGMANHADFQVQDLADGKLSPKRDAGGFSSTVFADEAVKFIQNAGDDQPFFLYAAFMAPHDPRNPPEKYREMYYKKRPPLPENFLPQHPFPKRAASHIRAGRKPCAVAKNKKCCQRSALRILRAGDSSGRTGWACFESTQGESTRQQHHRYLHSGSRAGDGQSRSAWQTKRL